MNEINILLYELVDVYKQYDLKKNSPLPKAVQAKLDALIEHIKGDSNKRVR